MTVMAQKVESHMNTKLLLSRRNAIQLGAATIAGAAATSIGAFGQEAVADEDIFQFALNLEYMETEYYLRATTGKGIQEADLGSDPGKVNGGHAVKFKSAALREFGEELSQNELAHVRFYREVLGDQAVGRPTIDFEAGFKAAASAAGLGDNFDAFENDMTFLLGGMLFEDVGVTAYAGAASLIKKPEFVDAAARILAVEAYHMGMARSQLYRMGEQARKAANALSDARDKVDGKDDKDQGIEVDGKANFVPTTKKGMVFTRTPQEVLRIVYLTDKDGAQGGGFYPEGIKGKIRTT